MALITSSKFDNVKFAISTYADAARADNAQLISTAMVGSNADITDAGEGFTGTLRWLSFSGDINVSNQSTSNAANSLDIANSTAIYVKNARNAVAEEASVQRLISKVDGLSYLGSKFGTIRALNEDKQVLSILKAVGDKVAGTDTLATAGLVGPTGKKFGYTIGATKLFPTATTSFARSETLNHVVTAISNIAGDQESPFYYLVISNADYLDLRLNNMVDTLPVVDGNVTFSTILNGKVRLFVTGSTLFSNLPSSFKASYLVKPSAFHYANVAQVNPTAISREELQGNGAGVVSVISRWGNIVHPMGYSYTNNSVAVTAFPTDANLETSANWSIVADNVNQTGIFPIYHA